MNNLQKQAFDKIISNDKNKFLIQGHGGTGKTYVAIEAIKYLKSQNHNVAILCPTHQAKEQFFLELPNNIRDSIRITTVASFLMQYPQLNQIGQMYFRKGGLSSGSDYSHIIVDEVSMVSEFEMKQLMKYNGKVIFLGDFKQLKPVMKKQGDFWQSIDTIILTEQHRNAGEILKLAESARDKLVYPVSSTQCNSINVYDNEDILLNKFKDRIVNSNTPYEMTYLAYRNEVVNKVSDIVHKTLYGNAEYVKGQYVRLGGKTLAGNNGSIVKIEDIIPSFLFFENHTFQSHKTTIRNIVTGCGDIVEFVDKATALSLKNIELSLIDQARDLVNMGRFDELEPIYDKLTKLRSLFVPCSSPFVQTVHKAQGRTIPYVYVNTKDISTGNGRRNLLYVAYSRAKIELNTVKI